MVRTGNSFVPSSSVCAFHGVTRVTVCSLPSRSEEVFRQKRDDMGAGQASHQLKKEAVRHAVCHPPCVVRAVCFNSNHTKNLESFGPCMYVFQFLAFSCYVFVSLPYMSNCSTMRSMCSALASTPWQNRWHRLHVSSMDSIC